MIPNDKDPPTYNTTSFPDETPKNVYTPFTLHLTTEQDFLKLVKISQQDGTRTKCLIHKSTVAQVEEIKFMLDGVERYGCNITIRLTPDILTSSIVTDNIEDILQQMYDKRPIYLPLETDKPYKPYYGPYN